MKRLLLLMVICLAVLSLAAGAAPNNFSLDWWTVDGGGGGSSGQGYTLDGAIGQPEAGAALSGGVYRLTGGYWNFDPPAPLPDSYYDVYLPVTMGGPP